MKSNISPPDCDIDLEMSDKFHVSTTRKSLFLGLERVMNGCLLRQLLNSTSVSLGSFSSFASSINGIIGSGRAMGVFSSPLSPISATVSHVT